MLERAPADFDHVLDLSVDADGLVQPLGLAAAPARRFAVSSGNVALAMLPSLMRGMTRVGSPSPQPISAKFRFRGRQKKRRALAPSAAKIHLAPPDRPAS